MKELTLGVFDAFHGTEPLAPAPDGIVHMAHAHATPNFELQRVRSRGRLRITGVPHLRQNVRQPDGPIMVHHANASDRGDGSIEKQFPVVEINAAIERTLQQLHQSESRRDDHLQDVIGRMAQQLAGRRLQIQDPSQERRGRNEEFSDIVASRTAAQKHKVSQVKLGGSKMYHTEIWKVPQRPLTLKIRADGSLLDMSLPKSASISMSSPSSSRTIISFSVLIKSAESGLLL